MLLDWANQLIRTGLSGGYTVVLVLGIGVACVGSLFAIGGLAVGARALKDL